MSYLAEKPEGWKGWAPPAPLVAQRGRFIHIMRRHVRAEDHNKTDDDFARTVYKRFYVNPELHLAPEAVIEKMTPETANLFEQRERYREIMRRHVHGEDQSLKDQAFIDQVYRRYAHWREVPLIDPNE